MSLKIEAGREGRASAWSCVGDGIVPGEVQARE